KTCESSGIFFSKWKFFQFVLNYFPLMSRVCEQTFFKTASNNENITKPFTELSGNDHSSFYVYIMLILAHKHLVLPTFVFLYYHNPPQFTTLISMFLHFFTND